MLVRSLNEADGPVPRPYDELPGFHEGEGGHSLAEALLLWSKLLEVKGRHVDGNYVARGRSAEEKLVVFCNLSQGQN